MCHLITWYYVRCVHPDTHSGSLIACTEAFKRGYECTSERLTQITFARTGLCPECKGEVLALRESILRKMKTDPVAALKDAIQYDEDDWSMAGSDDESESDDDMSTLDLPSPQPSSLTCKTATDPAESCASLHGGPAHKPTLTQLAMAHFPCSALVGHADNESDSETLVQAPECKSRTWRSWIPLPIRLLPGERSRPYMQLVCDGDMSDTEPLLGHCETQTPTVSRSSIPIPAKQAVGQ